MPMGDLREPDGGAAAGDDRPSRLPWTCMASNSSPSAIGSESWDRAEKAIQRIILKVQPSVVSEERRQRVIDYVQRLMRASIGCEVFPYGSVPLKTYLPDGDIDLSAFGGLTSEDVLADIVISVLQAEDQNEAAEFEVKDVQYISAEVKLVKCIIQNIVVDISFNQMGGLCTLCFLEQVDRLIGKENLFKRSIILIKAWCYYESRILGAHHGLISTYALETMVLYIFHLFHSSLNGPLAVLYKFLEYYSKFDWENYGISLSGPVRLSSLPDIVVETPDNGGGNLLLTSEFLGYCIDTFSVPLRGLDLNPRTFRKYLNIVDPLKENNNLGRSVNQGNFYRIRSAFIYGARKLGQILMEPEEDIDVGLCKFFSNTLDRHGSGQRPDVKGPTQVHSYISPAMVVSETESYQMERVIPQTESSSSAGIMEDCRSAPDVLSHNAVSDMKAPGGKNRYRDNNKEREGTVGVLPSEVLADADQTIMGKALGERILGDAEDLATSRFESLELSNAFPKPRDQIAHAPHYAPHLYFSKSILSNGHKGGPNSHTVQMENCKKGVSCGTDGDNSFGTKNYSIAGEDNVLVSAGVEDVDLVNDTVSHPENFHGVHLDSASTSASTLESLNPVPDLSGDYDSHFGYFQYAQYSFQCALGVAPLPVNALPPYLFQLKNLWDGAQQSSQFEQNGYSHAGVNGVIPGPAFYTVNPLLIPGMLFGLEEVPKTRGTGTYLPSMNRPLPRHSQAKGRSQESPRPPRNNNRAIMSMENNAPDHSSHELSQSPVSADQVGSKPGPSDVSSSFSPRRKVHSNASALVLQSHGGFEFSSAGYIDRGKQRHQKSPTSSPRNSGPVSPPNGMQRLKPGRDYDRVSMKSTYHLKDDEDFPPLSL